MDWTKLITELQAAGLSQADIGKEISGKSQAWVSAVAKGEYGDIKWSDGEKLRRLHAAKVSQASTANEKEAA